MLLNGVKGEEEVVVVFAVRLSRRGVCCGYEEYRRNLEVEDASMYF